MTLMAAFSTLLPDSHKLTPEELEKGKAAMLAKAETDASVYIAKDPGVFRQQVKCWAMKLKHAGHASQADTREPTKVELAAQRHREKIAWSRQVSRQMMGGHSIYAGVSFYDEGLQPSSVIDFLQGTPSSFLLLLGGPGCGKTRGAVCWVSERAGYSGTKTDAGNVDSFLNAKFVDSYEVWLHLFHKDKPFLKTLETIGYLIVDDLGTEKDGYRDKELTKYLEYLFSVRHRNQLPTVMTCNATTEQFKTLYGPRFISRFNEVGQYHESPDPDFRNGGNQ